MSRVTAVFTGAFLGLIVLVVCGRIDIVSLLWMLILLVLVFVVVRFNEHTSWLMPMRMRLQRSIPTFPMPKLSWKKHRGADWEEQMTTFRSTIADLGKELNALSSYVSRNRSKWEMSWLDLEENQHQEQMCLPSEPHQAFRSEFRALIKSLNWLENPANDRLEQEDLNFYRKWVGDLTDRFHVFLQEYISQQEAINDVLGSADSFQEKFTSLWQPMSQHGDYWRAYGSYCALHELLKEGVRSEYLFSSLHSLPREIWTLREKIL